jgi:transcription initiation factor IIE alpha subunit
MKREYLKRNGKYYICPNCGGILHYEDNQEEGEPATNNWLECYSCGFKSK